MENKTPKQTEEIFMAMTKALFSVDSKPKTKKKKPKKKSS